MAHHKSCIKRIKTSAKANERNRAYRSKVKTAVKRVQEAGTMEEAGEKLKSFSSLVDKMALKHIIHRSNADNKKSRLSLQINKRFSAK